MQTIREQKKKENKNHKFNKKLLFILKRKKSDENYGAATKT